MIIKHLHPYHHPPFGMQMGNKSYVNTGKGYRYGFNGMENDDEVKDNGNGNSLDFGARIYDSRLGRWMCEDPKQHLYHSFSTYNALLNNPIRYIDPNGMEVTYGSSGENNDKKDLRKLKRNVALLRIVSKSFRQMYREMDESTEEYQYTSVSDGLDNTNFKSSDDPSNSTGKNLINIGSGKSKWDAIRDIAHESGHAYRHLKNWDPILEKRPSPRLPPLPRRTSFLKKDWEKDMKVYNEKLDEYHKKKDDVDGQNAKSFVKYKEEVELGAMRIQDLVLSEVGRSPFIWNKKETKPVLNYSGGFVIKQVISAHGNVTYKADVGTIMSKTKPEFYQSKRTLNEVK